MYFIIAYDQVDMSDKICFRYLWLYCLQQVMQMYADYQHTHTFEARIYINVNYARFWYTTHDLLNTQARLQLRKCQGSALALLIHANNSGTRSCFVLNHCKD